MSYAVFLLGRGDGWVYGGEFSNRDDAKAEAQRRTAASYNPADVKEALVVQVLDRAKPQHTLNWT